MARTGNFKDLTSQRFGKLVVIGESDKRDKSNCVMWKCRCDCGNEIVTRGTSLRKGTTKSCGCITNAVDLTGQKFGKLTVIERNGYTNGKRKLPTWLCRCDCGNTAIRTGKALKSSLNSGCDNCRWEYFDLIGKTFGSLKVVSKHSSGNGEVVWNCECVCGKIIQVSTGRLNFGNVTSCGCMKRNRTIERNATHGLSNTRLYEIWIGMKKRCYDENSERYKDYGGRGITICSEWLNDFQAFYDWAVANGYRDDLTIERKDVNGNYCPENCEWIPMAKQMRNQRKTIRYTLFGIEKPLVEWCEYAEVKNSRAYQRYKNGNPPFDEEEMKRIKLKLENGGS